MHTFENKLEIEFRHGDHPVGWFVLNDKKVLQITVVNVHRGSSVAPGTLKSIINQRKLSNSEFQDRIECPMSL